MVCGCNPYPPGTRGNTLWTAWSAAGGIGAEPVLLAPQRVRHTPRRQKAEDREPVRVGLQPMVRYGVGARDLEGMR